MCGICGIFDFTGNTIDQEIIRRMKSAIVHRGPDGEGEFFDKEVGMGHRRLSIIDVGGGGQPIGNEDSSIQVVFNGEIYNFIELRRELQKCGHQFKTCSDTEVIVHAYEQWGISCVKRFNGMFAFALWDGNKRELFLARDHLGIKPLYYITLGNQFLFASEIKSLLQHKYCPREVDIDALAELFTFRYVPSPKTLFKNIMKLPPAHTLVVSRSGIRIERFWNWEPVERKEYNEPDLIEEYQALLEDAVKLQLRSDVPLGLFLSSGVDSGMLLAIMSKHNTKPVQTFTIGFEDGEKTNEVADAKILAQMFGADHYHQILGPSDYVSYYERYMWDLEEPVGNETAAAFYFVSKLTSQHVKVALTGQGADEPWAGYDRHKGAKFSGIYSQLPCLVTNSLASLISMVPGRMERLKRGVVSLSEPDMLTRLIKIYSFFSADMKGHLYTGTLKQAFEADHYGTRHTLSRLQKNVKHLDPLSQMLYIDTRANLPDDLLMVGDKTSMANSLESRVPFLDYRLVQFVESLPPELKLNGFNGKYLHKKAAEKWLPKNIVHRKKKGFANPIEDWFRVGMKNYVEECLLSNDSAVARYFNQDYIRQILSLDRSGKEQYRRQIYLLVSFELWHRKFISN
ncbi:MAG: asparagine synthase (glutamine-hydrolyzing) [Methylobacter sp.]|nr:asparagine synthase (glutamine-hydrolyzing) [Methylobacter sp.]